MKPPNAPPVSNQGVPAVSIQRYCPPCRCRRYCVRNGWRVLKHFKYVSRHRSRSSEWTPSSHLFPSSSSSRRPRNSSHARLKNVHIPSSPDSQIIMGAASASRQKRELLSASCWLWRASADCNSAIFSRKAVGSSRFSLEDAANPVIRLFLGTRLFLGNPDPGYH